MKKTVKVVDEKRGIFQATSLDERWYTVMVQDEVTNLPKFDYYPSSSWVAGYDFMPPGLLEWAKKNGIESDQIMLDAAARGSKIHHAIEKIIAGETIEMDTKVFNGQSSQEEELTTEEWEILKTFVDWNNECTPMYLLSEKTVISKKHKYGGTLDAVVKIGDVTYLVDFKTSKSIYTSHRVQLSSYKHALIEETPKAENIKLAILQVGYRLNRKGWKFTEIEDVFPRFLRDLETWKEENPNAKPRQIDLPIRFSIPNPLKLTKEVMKKVEPKKSKKVTK